MRRSALLAALLVLAALPASAQTYPTKPVTIISPAAAGNSPDVVTRVVAEKLSQLWGQQAVVINRPGAGGMIAAQAAAGLEKDGYSLYATQASTYNVLPIEQEGKLSVDLDKAFVAIGMIGEQPIAVAVNKDVPVKTVAELVAYANKTPDGVLFGATNRGGQSHLTGELFRRQAKANMNFVHAAGVTASISHVMAGRIPIIFEGFAGLQAGLAGGAVRLLAVAAPKRLPDRPNLPTINETVPGVESSGWVVLMAPAGTPDAIVRKINADLRKVVAMPDVIERFHQLGTYTRDFTPAQTAEFVRGEEKLWWPIVRSLKEKR